MAISFHGTVAAFIATGSDQTTQNLFAIENGYASRHDINIKRIVVQNDPVNALTTVAPQVKVSRMSAASSGGGLFVNESSLIDSTETSDPNLSLMFTEYPGTVMSGTAGTVLWQQFATAQTTLFGQVNAYDGNLLPYPLCQTAAIILHPGQNILVQVVGAATTSNASITNNWWVEVQWEENTLTTFAISGTVTLNATPISGAKVFVLEADDESGTNIRLVDTQTTDASGNWASSIRSGCVGSAFAQYVSGGTYYTAPGNPYLE